MLSAAHVLAMDSKNLLDVVDANRIRYPHLNRQLRGDDRDLQPEKQPLEHPGYSKNLTALPTPVTCTFVQYSAQNIQTAASSSHVSTNQIGDS